MTTASLSRSTMANEILDENVQSRARPRDAKAAQAAPDPFADISSNPFYSTMFNAEMSPEQRKDAATQLMVSTLETQKDREKVREFEMFREWLAAQSTELAKQIIDLTNVDSMSALQGVINDMNGDFIDFEDDMKPILEIIESVYKLRTSGSMDAAFREIRANKEREVEIANELAAIEGELEKLHEQNWSLGRDSRAEGEKRSLFGFGGVPEAARIAIANNDAKVAANNERIFELEERQTLLQDESEPASALGEMAVHRDRLRELLDLSDEGNRERMIGLRDKASRFITTAQKRTGGLRTQFDGMNKQVDRVQDLNGGMTQTYAILGQSLQEAEKINLDMRKDLSVEPEGETMLQKLDREQKLNALDNHVDLVKRTEADTLATYADQRQQAMRVHTMKGAVSMQIDTARKLNTTGVAATADRVATVLTAITGASLSEASAAASDTLQRMRNSTNDVAGREVIRVAMGIEALVDNLESLAIESEQYSDISKAATGMMRNGFADLSERMKGLRSIADELGADLRERNAVASEHIASEAGKAEAGPAVSAPASPFLNM